MAIEPPVKRTIAFFDGQNLFHHAKAAFGHTYPNFDPGKLTGSICSSRGWAISRIHFYTGVPSSMDKPFWNHFWTAKMAVVAPVGQEKGIDVRIALDIVRYALDDKYDVALIFSQDQDLSEAVDDVKKIAKIKDRWIRLACAFPVSPTVLKARGINGTDWIRIDRATYDACIDPNDYRPKGAS